MDAITKKDMEKRPLQGIIKESTPVLWNKDESFGYFRLGVGCDHAKYKNAKPGQFVMVGLSGSISPFLRRPFSIFRLIKDNNKKITGLEILCKVVGKATKALSMCKKGDILDLLGPLGNHFAMPEKKGRIFLIAGGVGVAPLFFMAETLKQTGFDLSSSELFLGGRSEYDILCLSDFSEMGFGKIHVTTDNGSKGTKELVTKPFERAIKKKSPDFVYACGPMPMLNTVQDIALKHNIFCQISIETMMACGLGACLGCAIKPKNGDGYLHACKDGPVFLAGKI